MDFLKQNRIAFFAAALLLAVFMQIKYPIPLPTNYVFFGYAAFVVLLSMGGQMKVNIGMVLLLGAVTISILGNSIPDFFKPWSRFILFLMLAVGCSPLISSPEADKMKRQMNMGGLWACFFITILSFVAYLTGQGMYMSGFVQGYMGITGHPNFLGYYIMVTMAGLASLYFRTTNNKERIIIAGLWGACIITILLSASRSATGLGLVGSMIAGFLRLQKDTAKRYRVYMIMACAVVIALPYLIPYTSAMMQKEMNFDDGGEAAIAATRGFIWNLRYQELAKSPIIGIGAYSCDTTLPSAETFYNSTTGAIELGSSYLGLLAQSGWLAFLAFLLMLVPIVLKTIKYCFQERTPYAQFFFPMLLISLIHMFFEGYLMTAGAVQCVIVWMLISACDQCDKVADYPILWEKSDPITPEQYVYWRDHVAVDGDKR